LEFERESEIQQIKIRALKGEVQTVINQSSDQIHQHQRQSTKKGNFS